MYGGSLTALLMAMGIAAPSFAATADATADATSTADSTASSSATAVGEVIVTGTRQTGVTAALGHQRRLLLRQGHVELLTAGLPPGVYGARPRVAPRLLSANQTPMDQASSASLSAAIQRASGLLASDAAAAEREALAVLRLSPLDPRAALILGAARRRRGDLAGALEVLGPLAEAYPNAALTQYELGVTLAESGDANPAIIALRRATELAPDHADAWRVLGDLLFQRGETAAAGDAFAAHAVASVSDPALKPAAAALYGGRASEARALLTAYLAGAPDDVPALGMMAEAYAHLGQNADAEQVLMRCLELSPGFDGARFGLATARFRQQKYAAALPLLEQLAGAYPGEAAYLNLLAATLAALGEYDRAMALYEGLIATHQRQPLLWLNYGHALRTVGRTDEAVAAYRRCIGLDPGLGEPYLSLANLKVAAFTDEETAAMTALAARTDLARADRQQLGFALGKALEDRGEYAASFASYAEGAALRRAETPYDAEAASADTSAAIRVFTPSFFAERAGFGSAAADPIFIVGLPRAGSTLIEQILASHSEVEGTMELPDIGLIAQRFADYPDDLARLTAAESAALGEDYLRSTQVQRKTGRPLFLDKMPNNFQHISLIQLILPNAKIVDARRHPLATCFSAFKQHFAQGQAFTYDLADLGRYYRDYVALMAHVDAALPGRVCRVIYEDVVEDTEGQVRRLLHYLGLPFEPACLAFHETERAVRTVSSEQVRRPIFRDGLDQWRNYEPWLGPLKAALGPALETWRA
jgi:predicted Zn-dependent protease